MMLFMQSRVKSQGYSIIKDFEATIGSGCSIICISDWGKISGNVLAGDEYSIPYDRTPEQILMIVHGPGDETVPEVSTQMELLLHEICA
ncbi:hypothetical protein SLEP1_g57098 [Rubroshorea leprosula]|uniref:Uncharacterized protein n=1 Tax=Rubroshorea leprosula TaxID=152421 RepID=A0AAV5MP66_9ROSI|nr:hypothetical protein SLEP1_g57098 [Rubroshorea leprosula]